MIRLVHSDNEAFVIASNKGVHTSGADLHS